MPIKGSTDRPLRAIAFAMGLHRSSEDSDVLENIAVVTLTRNEVKGLLELFERAQGLREEIDGFSKLVIKDSRARYLFHDALDTASDDPALVEALDQMADFGVLVPRVTHPQGIYSGAIDTALTGEGSTMSITPSAIHWSAYISNEAVETPMLGSEDLYEALLWIGSPQEKREALVFLSENFPATLARLLDPDHRLLGSHATLTDLSIPRDVIERLLASDSKKARRVGIMVSHRMEPEPPSSPESHGLPCGRVR